jgi:cytochrome c oxidase subunit 3
MGFVLTNDIRKFYLPKFFTFSTLLILVSSYSMARTKGAFKADNIKLLHTSLLFSFLLAQLFIYSQLKGWRELDEHGIYFSGEANGSYLYLLSGLHLAHFLGGIIYLFIVYLKVYQAFRDPVKNIIYVTDPFEAMKLDLLNLYWHFMGVLWLIMYLVFFAFTM